eukprot:2139763-Amphidinium_carterae.1
MLVQHFGELAYPSSSWNKAFFLPTNLADEASSHRSPHLFRPHCEPTAGHVSSGVAKFARHAPPGRGARKPRAVPSRARPAAHKSSGRVRASRPPTTDSQRGLLDDPIQPSSPDTPPPKPGPASRRHTGAGPARRVSRAQRGLSQDPIQASTQDVSTTNLDCPSVHFPPGPSPPSFPATVVDSDSTQDYGNVSLPAFTPPGPGSASPMQGAASSSSAGPATAAVTHPIDYDDVDHLPLVDLPYMEICSHFL